LEADVGGGYFASKFFGMDKTFILSDSSVINSYGFKVDLKGLNTDRFKDNPVMLFEHDGRNVIGRWNNLRVDGGKLMAEAEFDTDDTLGKEVSRKVEKGFLKGCSAGFLINKVVEEGGDYTVTFRLESLYKCFKTTYGSSRLLPYTAKFSYVRKKITYRRLYVSKGEKFFAPTYTDSCAGYELRITNYELKIKN
jgi:HK97 family phage prohead protease